MSDLSTINLKYLLLKSRGIKCNLVFTVNNMSKFLIVEKEERGERREERREKREERGERREERIEKREERSDK